MPGTGFKICSRERLTQDEVDNIIILPHNFGNHIANSLRYDESGNNIFTGSLITMLPKIKVIWLQAFLSKIKETKTIVFVIRYEKVFISTVPCR